MTTILSIDPGGSKKGETGIAFGYYEDDKPYELTDSWAVPNNIDGFREWFYNTEHAYYTNQRAIQLLDRNGNYDGYSPVDIVVCEKWVDRGIRGADRSPMLVEGAVRFLWPDAVMQGASGKNTAVSDLALKNLGVYTAGGHHRDILEATRHAVWYVKNQRHMPTLLKGWPPE